MESGVITNKWYQSRAVCHNSCYISVHCHSAYQSIARLLHQSASRFACTVCVTPPACVYSLPKFLKSPTLICNHALSSCRSIHHSIVGAACYVVRTVEICEFISVLMLREGTHVWLRCLTNVNPNFLLTAGFLELLWIPSYAQWPELAVEPYLLLVHGLSLVESSVACCCVEYCRLGDKWYLNPNFLKFLYCVSWRPFSIEIWSCVLSWFKVLYTLKSQFLCHSELYPLSSLVRRPWLVLGYRLRGGYPTSSFSSLHVVRIWG